MRYATHALARAREQSFIATAEHISYNLHFRSWVEAKMLRSLLELCAWKSDCTLTGLRIA
eukprot:744414-Pleurochrysis_carterae.AAC.1